jgi:hypothetical protein
MARALLIVQKGGRRRRHLPCRDHRMTRLAHRVVATALLTLIPSLGCGGASRGNDSGDSGGNSGSGPDAKGCEVDGKAYRDGESVPSQDGCNTCFCSDGDVACTTVDCLEGCLHQGKVYQPFEQFPAGDDCNTCRCLEDGSVSCTMVECGVCRDIESEYARALEQAKSCDPQQSNPCSEAIVEGLVCGCEAFVNPQHAEAIAQVKALQKEHGAGQCGEDVTCGPCLPPLSARCSLTESRCEPVYDAEGGAGCKVSGVVYASGSDNIPDPVSCNTCQCLDGQLLCTEISCPVACPPDSVYGAQCAQCGPADGCEVVEHACLPVCSGSCEGSACIDGVCRSLCG